MEKHFAVCSISVWNAREGSPGHTLTIESSYGSKKGRTLFASTGVGKQSNQNCGHEVLLTNDPQRSTTQSPVGKVAILRLGIRNQVGRLNILPN